MEPLHCGIRLLEPLELPSQREEEGMQERAAQQIAKKKGWKGGKRSMVRLPHYQPLTIRGLRKHLKYPDSQPQPHGPLSLYPTELPRQSIPRAANPPSGSRLAERTSAELGQRRTPAKLRPWHPTVKTRAHVVTTPGDRELDHGATRNVTTQQVGFGNFRDAHHENQRNNTPKQQHHI